MIMSINLDTKEVKLVSVMRDTWLNLGTDSYGKANAAYAKGSYKQAINMLNMNLDLNITDFVTVGFDGLIDAIDAIGGIEIDVKESEIEHLNNYQICMVGYEDGTLNAAGEPNYKADPGTYTPVTKSGLQTLNGLQATAYARIRYVGNDTARTSRQRTVLTQAAKKAMTMNVSSLNKIVDTVLPQVYTSLSKTEILSLIAGIAGYSIGENSGFPFDDYVVLNGRINGASVVVPVDLTKNVSLLHEFLFGEENYEPTETVKRCSQKIASDSGYSYNGD
jgi:anionic cell wall polymer biosynthesis LytR-Cps2A-Psr (LCP) family protein